MSASVFLSCERHVQYETKEEAQAFIKARWALGRKKAEGLKPFKCPSGKHYHVGRDRRFRRR